MKRVDGGPGKADAEAPARLLDFCLLGRASVILTWAFNKTTQYFIHSVDIYFRAYKYTNIFLFKKALEIWIYIYSLISY